MSGTKRRGGWWLQVVAAGALAWVLGGCSTEKAPVAMHAVPATYNGESFMVMEPDPPKTFTDVTEPIVADGYKVAAQYQGNDYKAVKNGQAVPFNGAPADSTMVEQPTLGAKGR